MSDNEHQSDDTDLRSDIEPDSDGADSGISGDTDSTSTNIASSAAASCPPFDADHLERQLRWDSAARWILFVLVVLLLAPSFVATWYGPGIIPPALTAPFTVLVVVLWIWMGTTTRRAADRLMRATALLEHDGELTETYLADGMRRRPIGRSIRLLLYHRLAVLRHRQGQFFEVGVIAQSLLAYPLRSVEHIRTHLLLLLAESQLRVGNPTTAHGAMQQLHKRKLQLVESLQLLALQTQYEVSLGYHADALNNLDEKIRLAEIMPGPQCGALHAMLATAANQTQRQTLADWLQRRAELLCSSKQLNELSVPPLDMSDAAPL